MTWYPQGVVAAGSPILERLRRQLGDASELYCCSAGNLAHRPARAHIDEEHKVIFDAAVADLAVSLLSQHLETTARHVEAIVSGEDAKPSPLDTIAADGPGPGGGAPVR